MKRFATGYRADSRKYSPLVPHHQFPGLERAIVLPKSATNSVLLPLIGGVGDQQTMGACVGYTFGRDMLGLAIAGQTSQAALYSGLACYVNARLMGNKLDGLPLGSPITDGGSEPSAAVAALYTTGPSLESEWPSNPSIVNETTNLLEAGLAATRIKLVNNIFGAIVSEGQALIDAVCQALLPLPDGRLGRAVSLEVPASGDDFQEATGLDLLPIPADDAEIDHEVSVIDYRTNMGGNREFRLLNHWGTTLWAAQSDIPGTVWVNESYILQCRKLGARNYLVQAEVA